MQANLDPRFDSVLSTANLSPRVFIDDYNMRYGPLFIIREDLLPGGTKQRGCAPLLESLVEKGYSHFIYASPFCGYAQVTLAYVCQQMGLPCQIFCERAPFSDNIEFKHSFTKVAESYGAKIYMTDTLAEAEKYAEALQIRLPKSIKIPVGFDCPEFKSALEKAIRTQWSIITELFEGPPRRLWLPVGRATLASVFSKIVDDQTEIKCVNLHVLESQDERIQAVVKNSKITLYSAPEAFGEPSRTLTEIPSNTHYDAKVWQFLVEHGESGDLWWNVAR